MENLVIAFITFFDSGLCSNNPQKSREELLIDAGQSDVLLRALTTVELEASAISGLSGVLMGGRNALGESLSVIQTFPLLSPFLCFFLGFLPSGKVLALIIHDSSPALHFAALESQVRVEAFLSLHLSRVVSPHLSLQITSDYFHQWPWLL